MATTKKTTKKTASKKATKSTAAGAIASSGGNGAASGSSDGDREKYEIEIGFNGPDPSDPTHRKFEFSYRARQADIQEPKFLHSAKPGPSAPSAPPPRFRWKGTGPGHFAVFFPNQQIMRDTETNPDPELTKLVTPATGGHLFPADLKTKVVDTELNDADSRSFRTYEYYVAIYHEGQATDGTDLTGVYIEDPEVYVDEC